MTRRIPLLILIYCLIIFILSGCWDELNIEDRGFVVAAAIDLADEQKKGSYNLSLTNQFVNPAGYGTPEGGSSGGQETFTNVTANGKSMLSISRSMAAKISRSPFYEQLKILIISEDVTKQPHLFASVLDLFIRDHEMRRGIKVLISKGKAKDILEINPEPEKLPAKFIKSTLENSFKSIRMIDPVRIGSVHEYLLDENSFVLSRISSSGEKLSGNGVAVFRGNLNKMVGVLNKEETAGLNLIVEKNKGGVIQFEIEEHLMDYEIEETKSEIKINTDDPKNLKISVHITSEGKIGEMYGAKSLINPSYLKKIEGKIEAKMEELANNVLKKAQEELNAEIFGFSSRLKQKHYDTWEKIKNDWDYGENYFAKSDVNVSAKVTVRAIGAADRAKDKGEKTG